MFKVWLGLVSTCNCRKAIALNILFTFALNVFSLALPLYSMQIFDRVLVSSSIPTLAFLTVIMLILICATLIVDSQRSVVFVRIAERLDSRVRRAIGEASYQTDFATPSPILNSEIVRAWITGPVMLAIFDAPYAALFLASIFVLHPGLGWFTVLSSALLIGLSILNQALCEPLKHDGQQTSKAAVSVLDGWKASRGVARAMGLVEPMLDRYLAHRATGVAKLSRAQERAAWLEATSRSTRMLVQVGLMAIAAYLVVVQELQAGALVACSMLFQRALAPTERILGSTSFLRDVKRALEQIALVVTQVGNVQNRMQLGPLRGTLTLEGISLTLPNGGSLLHNIDLQVQAGELLLIVGPEGAGKSTLTQVLAGAILPSEGAVRIDGFEIRDYSSSQLGPAIGFLSDQLNIPPGSVASLIARGQTVDAEKVRRAATVTGAHEFIANLPNGYGTVVGAGGVALSNGQIRRLSVARAIYGDPRILILDDPLAHLDERGEQSVIDIITTALSLQTTVVAVCRHPRLAHLADRLVMLERGKIVTEKSNDEMAFFRMPKLAAGPLA